MLKRMEITFDYLKKLGKRQEFTKLYNEIAKIKESKSTHSPYDMSTFFTDLSIDGRFHFIREIKEGKEIHFFDIRENYTYEEIEESLATFGEAAEGEGDIEVLSKEDNDTPLAIDEDEDDLDTGDQELVEEENNILKTTAKIDDTEEE